MMVSERPSAPPPPPPDLPPAEIPPVPPPTTITPTAPVKLEPSPFLNGFDLLLVVGTIILGFAIASFAVRNADFWQHLGAGKLIAEGKYEFGKDPFSYTTEGRQWTNPSWLFDLIVYKIHGVAKGDGQQFGRAIVIFKAALIAMLAAVLLFARRPGQSMWIGVLCVGLALLASAPRLVMDPVIMSMFFLGVTIWLLIRADQFENQWSLPAAIAAVFALWSNSDAWFVLGPLTLGFFLLGEFLHQRMQPVETGHKRLPLRPLTIALIVGVLACMLNPHHVGVWRLPVELQTSVGEAVSRDAAFAPIFRSSFEKGGLDLDSAQGGNPINGVAFIALALLNVAALIRARNRLSWGLLLVNSGMLALALVRQRAIPFYAIVAAPITALYFGYVVEGLRQRTFTRGTMQGLAVGRVAARMFLFIAGLLALTATWPGWLHPLGQQRRLSWDVVPDPSFEKAARLLQQCRMEGRIPSEARSLILSPELAAYCAYYAPSEKTYFDGRVGLHAPEADNFFKVRQNLMGRKTGDSKPPEFDVDKFLGDQKIAFVVMTGRDREEGLLAFRRFSEEQYQDHEGIKPKWILWEIAGRTATFGWAPQKPMPSARWSAMRFNSVERAFGAEAAPMADAEVPLPPTAVQQSFIDKQVRRFLEVPPEPSAEADEAILLNQHQQTSFERLSKLIDARYRATVLVWGTLTEPFVREILTTEQIPAPFRANAVLAIRAARRGIVHSPNHLEGYYALAASYNSPAWYTWSDDFKTLISVCSLQRYYLRLSPELQSSPSDAHSLQAALQLYQLHLIQGRLDLAAEYMRRWVTGFRSNPRPPNVSEAQFQERLKILDQELRKLEEQVRTNENLWLNNTAKVTSQLQRALVAQSFGLVRKSLQELNAIDTSDAKKLSRAEIYIILFQRIRLNLIVGQAEEADEVVRMIEEGLQKQLQNDQSLEFDQEEFRKAYFNVVRFYREWARSPQGNAQSDYRNLAIDTMLVLGRFNEAARYLNLERNELEFRIEQTIKATRLPLTIKGETKIIGFPEIIQLWIGHRLCVRPGIAFTDLLYAMNIPFYEMSVPNYVAAVRSLEEMHFKLATIYLEQGNNEAAARHYRHVTGSASPGFRTERQVIAQVMLNLLRSK